MVKAGKLAAAKNLRTGFIETATEPGASNSDGLHDHLGPANLSAELSIHTKHFKCMEAAHKESGESAVHLAIKACDQIKALKTHGLDAAPPRWPPRVSGPATTNAPTNPCGVLPCGANAMAPVTTSGPATTNAPTMTPVTTSGPATTSAPTMAPVTTSGPTMAPVTTSGPTTNAPTGPQAPCSPGSPCSPTADALAKAAKAVEAPHVAGFIETAAQPGASTELLIRTKNFKCMEAAHKASGESAVLKAIKACDQETLSASKDSGLYKAGSGLMHGLDGSSSSRFRATKPKLPGHVGEFWKPFPSTAAPCGLICQKGCEGRAVQGEGCGCHAPCGVCNNGICEAGGGGCGAICKASSDCNPSSNCRVCKSGGCTAESASTNDQSDM